MSGVVTVYWSRWECRDGVKAHQAEHEAGLRLLAAGLAGLYQLGVSPESLEGMLGHGPHGKPFLPARPDIHFNISHSDGVVVCAFADSELGVDIERPAPFTPRLPQKALTEEERGFLERWGVDEKSRQETFFRLWTLKESLLKQSGVGLSRALDEFSFCFPNYPNTEEIWCSESGLYFTQRDLAEQYILSICTETPCGAVVAPCRGGEGRGPLRGPRAQGL